MTTITRDQEIQDIHSRYADFYKIAGGLTLVLVGIWIGALLFAGKQADGYTTNVFTEVLSVFATILVLDRLNEWRAKQAYRRNLIREAGSVANPIAVDAIEQLRQMGLLAGDEGVLKGAKLGGANLEMARLPGANLLGAYLGLANLSRTNLGGADLLGANLGVANLSGANLSRANLSGAYLGEANLSGAYLEGADLSGARLWGADLSGVRLNKTNLSGADLWRTNLSGAKLEAAIFDEKTVLPDAEFLTDSNEKFLVDENGKHIFIYDKYWTSDTEMTRYTDPEHPDFWQPDKSE